MDRIIEVKQKWPEDYLRIDFSVGDICNFQCWYCWPEAHAAEHKWPDYDLLVKNLSAMLDYYIEHGSKKRFEFCLLGGEVTHWNRFLDFIKYFKTRYDCIFNLITNGSKKFEWWVETAPYVDYVAISHHQEFSKVEHNRKVLDHLYEQGVIGLTTVLMDPNRWDECMESIEYYKKSKHRWSIRYGDLIHKNVNYTDDQKKIIGKVRARRANPFWFFWNNKLPRISPKVVYENKKEKRITDTDLILYRQNNFKGWECSLGVDWLAIKIDGTLSGSCSNPLYRNTDKYNLYDNDFAQKFKPVISSAICLQEGCWCGFETNMSKKKIVNQPGQKVIPIVKI